MSKALTRSPDASQLAIWQKKAMFEHHSRQLVVNGWASQTVLAYLSITVLIKERCVPKESVEVESVGCPGDRAGVLR